MAIERIKILGAVLELTASTANSTDLAIFVGNGLDWYCCLADNYKTDFDSFNCHERPHFLSIIIHL